MNVLDDEYKPEAKRKKKLYADYFKNSNYNLTF